MKEKMEVRMKEKMNNKGFSLVELIIVIAIMAVLIAVLAPQFLKYVERSRFQKDLSAIGEVENAAKIAVSNEKIASDVLGTTGKKATITISSAGVVTCDVTSLKDELEDITGLDLAFTSTTFKNLGATSIVIVIDGTSGFALTKTGVPTPP